MSNKSKNVSAKLYQGSKAVALMVGLAGLAPAAFGATEYFSASVNKDQWVHFGPFDTTRASELVADMTGEGDADLYVRVGAQPSTNVWDCRPYTGGSSEVCAVDGGELVYVSVKGYSAASQFNLRVQYTAADATPPPSPPPPPPATPDSDIWSLCANKPSVDCSSYLADEIRGRQADGGTLHLPAGVYQVGSLELEQLNTVRMSGDGIGNTIINTNRLLFNATSDLAITGISFNGIDTSHNGAQGFALVNLKSADTLSFTDNEVTNAAESLLSVVGGNSYNISGNTLSNSGIGQRTPGGKQSGTGIGVDSGYRGTINNNTLEGIRGIGVWINNSNTEALTIDNTDVTNHIYGTGIYIEADDKSVLTNTRNVTITNGDYLGFTINGIRINGDRATVKWNTFNSTGSAAIKAEILSNSFIDHNIIHNSTSGIELVSKAKSGIYNVQLNSNEISDTSTGIAVSWLEKTPDGVVVNGSYSDIKLESNVIRRSAKWGVTFWSQLKTWGTRLIGNTISNGTDKLFGVAAINLQNQMYPLVCNNWIYGQAGSANYAHVYVNDTNNGSLKFNSIISPNGIDSAYGGIRFNNALNNTMNKNVFTNLDPGIHYAGTSNIDLNQEETFNCIL